MKQTTAWKMAVSGLALIVCAAFCPAQVRAGDAPPVAPEEEQLDVVYRTGHTGQPPIKISEDNWLVVKGEKGNFHPEYLSSTVESVDYHDRTPRWNLAMERIQSKNWPKALVNFKKMFDPADKDFAKENPPIAATAWSAEIGNYYYGVVLLKNGMAKEAAEKYNESFKAKATGRYSLLSLIGAADANLQAGQLDEAIKSLAQFDTQLTAYNQAYNAYKFPATMIGAALACREYEDSMRIQGLYVQAKVLYQKAMRDVAVDYKHTDAATAAESVCEDYVRKNTDQADKVDRAIAKLNPNSQRVEIEKLTAEWTELNAQGTLVSNMLVDIRIALKDFDRARSKCQDTINTYEKSRDPRLISRLPAAYAGLGKVAFFEADNLRQKNDPIKAQKMYARSRWYYQHVMVMYFDNSKYLQDALYFTGLCNEYLASVNVEKDAREKAYDCFKRLAEMLPETDPLYKDVSAALDRNRPAGGVAPVAPTP